MELMQPLFQGKHPLFRLKLVQREVEYFPTYEQYRDYA